MGMTIEPESKDYGVILSPPELTVKFKEDNGYDFNGDIKVYDKNNSLIKSETVSGNTLLTKEVNISDCWGEIENGDGRIEVSAESVIPISDVVISSIPVQTNTLYYNNKDQIPTWSNTEGLSYSIQQQKNAGTYYVSFTPMEGYEWWDGSNGSKIGQWKINTSSNDAFSVYPSSELNINVGETGYIGVKNYYNGTTTSYSVNPNGKASITSSKTNEANIDLIIKAYSAGSFVVSLTNYGTNYSQKTVNITVNILNKQKVYVDIPYANNTQFYYDGSYKYLDIVGYDSSTMTMDGINYGYEPGNYCVAFSLKDSNYVWMDGTQSTKYIDWVIYSSGSGGGGGQSSINNDISVSTTSITLSYNQGTIVPLTIYNNTSNTYQIATTSNGNFNPMIDLNDGTGYYFYKYITIPAYGSSTINLKAGTPPSLESNNPVTFQLYNPEKNNGYVTIICYIT